MDHRVEEIDDEGGDQRQQHVQGHVVFLNQIPIRPGQGMTGKGSDSIRSELVRWSPSWPAHDFDSGSITPSEKNTSPANRPKKPTKRRSMMITSTSRLSVRVGGQIACNAFSDIDSRQGAGSIAMQDIMYIVEII
jgi:hypothetical protein